MKRNYSRVLLYILTLMLMIGILNQEVRAASENRIARSIFNDISASDQDIVFINYISHRGIIKGYPDGSFHPQAGLTRAEAAAILVRTAGLSAPQVASATFQDVPVTHWASAQIAAAANAGYLKGFPDGTYRPEAKVTRAQGIALVMRLCTQKERAALPKISDMDSQHWAAGDMATALALEMIGLSKDSQSIYPDAEMSRGSLARALSVLLTKDPGLNVVSLEGRASEVKGQVTLIRQGKTQELKDKVSIVVGDTIKTGEKGSLRINYPDGSSNLVEPNTEINIKQADGRRYIKEDGSPGIAVEYLNVGMPKGTMFGGVATKHESQQENTGVNPVSGQSSKRFDRVSALQSFNCLAAADNSQASWYKTAEKKKVKVKVDMPWGVAAIRGTYLMITVNQDGSCQVSCLTGNVDVSSNNSNQSVSVGGGMTSGIAGENGGAQTAAPMTAGEKQDFGNKDVQAWILQSALQQDVNQEAQVAPPVVQMVVDIPDNTPTITAVQVVLDALTGSGIQLNPAAIESLKQQIEEIQNQVSQQTIQQISQQVDQVQSQSNTPSTPGNNTSLSSGGGGSPAGVTLANPGAQSVIVGQSITLTLSPNPADATVTATSSVPGVATVTVSGNTMVINGVTTGTATINVSAAKTGYQAATVSFTVTVNTQPTVTLTDPGAQSVTLGQSITLTQSPNPADATITATSSATGIATVTVSGNDLIIEGVSLGSASITVTAQKPGYTDSSISFTVNVNNPAEQRIFNNWNSYGCAVNPSGPPSPTTFTLSQPLACATQTGPSTDPGLHPGAIPA